MTLNEDELTYPRGMYKISTDLTREHLWTGNPTYVGFSMLSGWNTDGTPCSLSARESVTRRSWCGTGG